MQTQSHHFSSRARKSLTRLAVTAPFVIAAMTIPAAATLLLTDKTNCTTINCDAYEVHGALSGTGTNISNPRSVPWIAQVLGLPNTCLRFHVIESNNNASDPDFLEMTVISPNNGVRTQGFIQNPSEPNKNCCPRVVVGSVPVAGYYTVILNDNGGGPYRGRFTMKYQAYNIGNPNCNNPTQQQ